MRKEISDLIGAVIVFAAVFGGLYIYFSPAKYRGEKTIPIEAGELLTLFDRDEAIATNRFDGEWLEISARISPSQTETLGRGVAIYLRPTDYDSGILPDLRRIRCFLSDVGEEQYYSKFQSGGIRREFNVIGTFLHNNLRLTFEECQFN